MSKRNFANLLTARWKLGCTISVGLDPDPNQLPYLKDAREMTSFLTDVVLQTASLTGAYKFNPAFFDVYGPSGRRALQRLIAYIQRSNPSIPIILDGKWGDVEHTNQVYAEVGFGRLNADAITVNPLVGEQALQPFLKYQDKGVLVLCHTSNPGAGEFQDLHTLTFNPHNKLVGLSAEEWLAKLCKESMTLSERIAVNVASLWNKYGNCGLVVGAGNPLNAEKLRRHVPDIPFLIPGIGAQGGDVEGMVLKSKGARSTGILVHSGRDIIFNDNPHRAMERLHDRITHALEKSATPT